MSANQLITFSFISKETIKKIIQKAYVTCFTSSYSLDITWERLFKATKWHQISKCSSASSKYTS